MSMIQYVGLFFIIYVAVFWKRVIRPSDRLESTWTDALIKAIAIAVFLVLFVVLIPSWALQTQTVADMDRMAQDLIGSGLWLGGLAIGLGALWLGHRDSRL